MTHTDYAIEYEYVTGNSPRNVNRYEPTPQRIHMDELYDEMLVSQPDPIQPFDLSELDGPVPYREYDTSATLNVLALFAKVGR